MAREPDPLPADEERRCYLEGIALFNHRRYFDAHEAWEEVWKRSTGNHRLFYQGLIQCAVALEHMKRGNPKGARSLLRNLRRKFAPLPRVYMGCDIWSLVEATARALSPITDPSRATRLRGEPTWPVITLRQDPLPPSGPGT